MIKAVVLFSVIFSIAHASATPLLGGLQLAKSSDDIETRLLSTINKYEEYTVFAKALHTRFGSADRDVFTLGGSYSFEVNETNQFRLSSSVKTIEKKAGTQEIQFLPSLQYKFSSLRWLQIDLSYRETLPSEDLGVVQVDFVNHRDKAIRAGAIVKPFDYLKIAHSEEVGYRADGNRRVATESALSFAISKSWPWIWVGYGYSGLKFDRTSVGYWSPQDFKAHGPRFDSSFPIYQKFSGILALNLNQFNEGGFEGNGYLSVVGLQWGGYMDNHVKVTWSKIKSAQSNSAWIYNALNFNLQWYF